MAIKHIFKVYYVINDAISLKELESLCMLRIIASDVKFK